MPTPSDAAPGTMGAPAAPTILVVDDERNIRRTLDLVLSGAGYQVLTAPDAEEARLMLDSADHRVDLAIVLGDVTQCRTTQRTFTTYGQVASSSVGDPTDPGTQLAVDYDRDAWGNVWRTNAPEAFGHRRAECVTYEPDGIFPYAVRNSLGHTAYVAFDPGLGVKTTAVDPNNLVTQWAHDGFGRATEEIRPDTTFTTSALTRVKDGGPQGTWWNLKVTTQEEAGPSTTTTLD